MLKANDLFSFTTWHHYPVYGIPSAPISFYSIPTGRLILRHAVFQLIYSITFYRSISWHINCLCSITIDRSILQHIRAASIFREWSIVQCWIYREKFWACVPSLGSFFLYFHAVCLRTGDKLIGWRSNPFWGGRHALGNPVSTTKLYVSMGVEEIYFQNWLVCFTCVWPFSQGVAGEGGCKTDNHFT